MSGISGLWNFDGRPVELPILRAISAELSQRGKDGEHLWMQGGVGLSCQLLRNSPESSREVQPFIHESGTVLVFDGRLDDRDELIAELRGERVDSAMPDPELVSAAYAKWGDDFVVHLKGDFAVALFDNTNQKLILGRDAIGPRPLYYTRTGQTLIFGTEIKAILAHPDAPREPNRDGIAGYYLGASGPERGVTLFKDIWRVIPSHVIVATSNGISSRKYWDFDPRARLRFKSHDQYVEAFRDHFERAVRRRSRSAYGIGVLTSGGLDSSSIYCLAETLRRKGSVNCPAILGISFTTAEGTTSNETAFLDYIERDYGTTIDRELRSTSTSVKPALDQIRALEMPLIELSAQENIDMVRAVAQKGARTLLTGHWGDQIVADQAYLVDLLYRCEFLKVRRHLKEIPKWFTDSTPEGWRKMLYLQVLHDVVTSHSPKFMTKFVARRRAIEVLRRRDCSWYSDTLRQAAVRAGSGNDLAWREFRSASARALYKSLRGSEWIVPLEYMTKWASGEGVDVAYPFLDRDVLEFGMQVPGEVHVWNGVPKSLLRKGMEGIVPKEIQNRTWKADVSYLENDSLKHNYRNIVKLLEGDTLSARLGFIDPKGLRQKLETMQERMSGPACTAAWEVEGLAGLEHWLQTFFANGEEHNDERKI
jgi:asparagine synthase (glutamine-hydrolysing)